MHFELFHLGPLTVYTYGFLIAVGILAAFFVAYRRGKAMGMDTSRLEAMTLTVCIAGFACSKLLYILTRLPDIIADPGILMNLEDGWVVYGGIIGGLLGGLWYCRRHQMNFMAWFDLLIPEVALAPAGIPLFPSQLISSAFDFGMFFFLCWIAKRKKFNGEVGAWYLILYSVGRFIIEFFRGDLIRGAVGTLSTSQFISIFTLAAGIIILVVMKKRTGKPDSAEHKS